VALLQPAFPQLLLPFQAHPSPLTLAYCLLLVSLQQQHPPYLALLLLLLPLP
jgi:hypothetical protein